MRIFFITSKLNFKTSGGSIEEFDLMMRAWQQYGDSVTCVTLFSGGNTLLAPLPYRLIEERMQAQRLIGIQRAVFLILKKYENEADIYHVDGHNFLYGAGLYRRLGGKVPVSAYFNREHTCWPQDRSIFFESERASLYQVKKQLRCVIERYLGMPLANGMDLFSFISPFYKSLYERTGLAKRQHSLVIGDPIDTQKLMRENGISPDSYMQRNKKIGPITIFFSSRMAPGKGFDVLLMGFSEVKNKKNFRVILSGAGPEQEHVHRMVKQLQLEAYVSLPGWVDREQLYTYYREADIFIQADWRPEGTSISLIYAMAFGLPSILPAGGGLQWIAKDCALYFKRHDYRELAQRIEQLGGDHHLREQLSRNCFKRLSEDEMKCEKQIEKLYRGMQALVRP